MKESELQAECNKILDENKILYFHLEKGGKFKQKKHSKGLPDLLIWHNGKSIFVELKKEGEALDKDQMDWMLWAELADIPHYVCRNINQFRIVLDKQGFIKY